MTGRITNNNDWFVATVCEQLEIVGRPKRNLKRRCVTWANTILVNAPTVSAAYDKALAISRAGHHRYKAVSGNTCYWKVVGIWDLTPVHNDIADGEEVFWSDEGNKSVRTALSLCKSKRIILKKHAQWISENKRKKKTRKCSR